MTMLQAVDGKGECDFICYYFSRNFFVIDTKYMFVYVDCVVQLFIYKPLSHSRADSDNNVWMNV